MNKVKNEYLKIGHQDGLIYFEDFRIADIMLIKKDKNTYRLDLDIKTYDGPYSKKETEEIESRLGQSINNEFNYAWLTIENKEIKLSSLEKISNVSFEIEKGWDEDAENGLAGIYFGWGIELLNNKINFFKEDKELYINWTAVSGDMDYYDERAKKTTYEMKIKVKVIELESKDDLLTRWKKLANMTDRYFEIISNMNGFPIQEKNVRVHEKIEEEYGMKHSIKAWELVPETMEKFPKEKIY